MLAWVKRLALHVVHEVARRTGFSDLLLTRSASRVRRMPPRRPNEALGFEVPDLQLPSTTGAPQSPRWRVGRGPAVLFFYILNGSPG